MLRSLLIALQFLTRLRVAGTIVPKEADLGRAAACFPLVGILAGGFAALVWRAASMILPAQACVVLALTSAAVMTNGLHEDGWADTFDGLGGGWSRDDALAIMRDSRIGTYGALALILLMLGKFASLTPLRWPELWRSLIIAHVASRWTALPLSYWLPYAREEGAGKFLAGNVTAWNLSFGTLIFISSAFLFPWRQALVLIAIASAAVLLCGIYFHRRLGGFTGDCLGAANQLVEVMICAGVLATRN